MALLWNLSAQAKQDDLIFLGPPERTAATPEAFLSRTCPQVPLCSPVLASSASDRGPQKSNSE
jgi:hypothetical protein